MEFTYYGDLIGVTSLYKLGPKIAYETLNSFYNTAFYSLSNYIDSSTDSRVYMFSDSIVVCGDDASGALIELEKLYLSLIFNHRIYLKGAIVAGKLKFDPRLERESFEKRLPEGTELVRAASLEKNYKGARLIIESALANSLLVDIQEWLTIPGYVNNVSGRPVIGSDDIRRRIIPTPEGDSYEYLYFWPSQKVNTGYEHDYNFFDKELSEISSYFREDISRHYTETINVLKRSRKRERYTRENL